MSSHLSYVGSLILSRTILLTVLHNICLPTHATETVTLRPDILLLALASFQLVAFLADVLGGGVSTEDCNGEPSLALVKDDTSNLVVERLLAWGAKIVIRSKHQGLCKSTLILAGNSTWAQILRRQLTI